jgi:hypothetical protein
VRLVTGMGDLAGDVVAVELLNADGRAGGILGTDVERQITRLAAGSDQVLGVVEVAFTQAFALEKIATVAHANGKIQ